MQFALWKIRSGMQALIQQEEGQDLVEYGLILALLATVAVASLRDFGTAVLNLYLYILSNCP